MKVICAWCWPNSEEKAEFVEEPYSHGICEWHLRQMAEQIKEDTQRDSAERTA